MAASRDRDTDHWPHHETGTVKHLYSDACFVPSKSSSPARARACVCMCVRVRVRACECGVDGGEGGGEAKDKVNADPLKL